MKFICLLQQITRNFRSINFESHTIIVPFFMCIFVYRLRNNEDEDYNYDVEDFLLRVVYLNLYNFGSFVSYCSPYRNCDDCTKCPETNYSSFADSVRSLFFRCSLTEYYLIECKSKCSCFFPIFLLRM